MEEERRKGGERNLGREDEAGGCPGDRERDFRQTTSVTSVVPRY